MNRSRRKQPHQHLRIQHAFERVEFLLFRIALLILFIIGLVRVVRSELGW